ncbi:MAG TPA: hypothetical protein VIL74_17275 [Pyrinomonadaceae bacterium]|jgi:hypothetical protein
MKKVDMSSEAITKRLRQVDRLRALCLSLLKAKNEADAKKERAEKKAKSENQL